MTNAAPTSGSVLEPELVKFDVWRVGPLVVAPLYPARTTDRQCLGYAYARFEREGLLPWIFGEATPSMEAVVRRLLEIPLLGLFKQEEWESHGRLFGLAWAEPSALSAEVGIAFFRRIGSRHERVRLGKMAATWALERLGLQELTCQIPAKHQSAIRYMQAIGFREAAREGGAFLGKLCAEPAGGHYHA